MGHIYDGWQNFTMGCGPGENHINAFHKPQVTHSQGLKMNFEENKTVKSYFSCSLLSLLGFWVVLEPFFFDFSGKRKKIKKRR